MADTLDDGAARGRRNGQGDCLQPANGTIAGGIKITEKQALVAQRIEMWRQTLTFTAAEFSQKIRAETLHHDQHDIVVVLRAWIVHIAQYANGVIGDKRAA